MGDPMCECGQREATYHEVVRVNGKVYERHLCEQCAAARGLIQPASPSVQEVLEQLTGIGPGAEGPTLLAPQPPRPQRRAPGSCPTCGMTFGAFKKTGLMGCPDCYEAFERQLTPLLERAHEGGSRHLGKTPKRALEASRMGAGRPLESVLGDARERAARLRHLQQQLDAAVKAEQFERAARLRDEIRRFTTGEGLGDIGALGEGDGGGGDDGDEGDGADA